MPDSAAHRDRAIENEEFAKHRLDIDDAVDRPWIVTAYFYAALHWVEAYLGAQSPPLHSRSHSNRKVLMAKDAKLATIQPLYRGLEDASRDARYELRVFLRPAVEQLQKHSLGPIRTFIDGLLTPPAPTPPPVPLAPTPPPTARRRP